MSASPARKPVASAATHVVVRGAREHNLKNVDVDIPRDALVVFTGISGSGKSSLAFGTLYAEAQRRYFESVAPYARRLIDQVGVPDFDSIDGLPPAVALRQQRGASNVRSSVGSVTTVGSLLRMLFSRAGTYPAGQTMLYAEDFSPNTPEGACETCHGLGRVYDVTERSMVPDDSLSIRERAIAAWPPAWHGQNLRDILVTLGHDVDRPWRDLPREERDWILFTDEQPTVPVYPGLTPDQTKAALKRKAEPAYQGTFTSARKYVLQTFATTQSALMKKRVSRYMTGADCPTCGGRRLKRAALAVTFAGANIGDVGQMTLRQLVAHLRPASEGRFDDAATSARPSRAAARKAIDARVASGGSAHRQAPDVTRTANLSGEKRMAATKIAADVLTRLQPLIDLGLGYLALDRATPTLSSGELQRIRLATQIRSNLFGVVYVLDEPTAGLHPADGEALLDALQRLKQGGNSLFVVEHDLEVMRRADWLIDVGPDAGVHGGEVLYSGPPDGLEGLRNSHTATYLFDRAPKTRHQLREPDRWLRMVDVKRNNLAGIDVALPLGVMTAITGISGSGKSSLLRAITDLLDESLQGPGADEVDDDEVDPEFAMPLSTEGRIEDGRHPVERVVIVDQKPIGRTPRSNLATYTGLFDHVRKLFASTTEARGKRYSAGRFSFNVKGGRCETCDGEGFVSVELLFMPSVFAPCPACHGARFNDDTLTIRYRDRNIADVLSMTVDKAATFFADQPVIARPLALLAEIGLGYLRLGQSATELSGGEAQRVKLATELQRPQHGTTLYSLDEPTTGLHPADVERLMRQLTALVDAGNTVVMVEHDMRVVAAADWVIDLGPAAGSDGGRIVASGPPREVAAHPGATSRYLSRALGA